MTDNLLVPTIVPGSIQLPTRTASTRALQAAAMEEELVHRCIDFSMTRHTRSRIPPYAYTMGTIGSAYAST